MRGGELLGGEVRFLAAEIAEAAERIFTIDTTLHILALVCLDIITPFT